MTLAPPTPGAAKLAAWSAQGEPASRQPLYPLALNTKWTYQVRQELGEGVRFNETDAKLAKGNILEAEILSAVKGSDDVGGHKYARVESVKAGRLVLTEWLRLSAGALLLGRSLDSDTGQQVEMVPPQKLVTATMKAGESWTWKAPEAPITIRTTVVGPAQVSVPAGSFDSIELRRETTIDLGHTLVTIRQTRWFVPGLGYVKEDNETRAGDRFLSRVALTLTHFESAKQAE